MEAVLEGKSIWGGIAIGKIHFHERNCNVVRRDTVESPQAELERYENAKAVAGKQLWKLYEKAAKEVGEENARIFEMHAMLLEDTEYNETVRHNISTLLCNAEYAVAAAGDKFADMFANMEDDYFRARATDMKDISQRVISVLTECSDEAELTQPVIIVAKELMPSETVQMDKENILGFATKLGTANSHTAILAKTMDLPAVAGLEITQELDGKMAVLDGFAGKMIVEPETVTLEYYRQRMQEELEKKEHLLCYKGQETINKYGKKVRLYANIGGISDVEAVLANDAEGIGLLRSEFLYLEEETYPSEEMLFQAYKQVAEAMEQRKVIIRTIDIGADKRVGYFQLDEEENPAMGYRAIRICLTREEIFRTQLRAILRASAYGNVAIMYPMITSVWEIRKIKEIAEQVKQELKTADIPYGEVEQGIMIETPAAAIISDLLAKEVDFFSIGTNDLSQYVLAVDRQNPRLEIFYDAHHEAILRLIRMTVENGHKEGIWVGICGELAADMELTDTFMEMGVDELSVAPSSVLALRKKILEKK